MCLMLTVGIARMKFKRVIDLLVVFLISAGICFSGEILSAQDVVRSTAAGTVTWSQTSNYLNEVTLVRPGTSHGDGYDGAMRVSVSGSGVSYTIDYTFSSTYGAVIQEVAVSNDTGSVTSYTINSYGNLGSDSNTYWHYANASGGYYTISSDKSSASSDSGDPVISFMYGDASLDVYSTTLPYSNGSDTHSFTVSNVTINPGETQRWLFLGGVGDIDDSTYNRPDQAIYAVLNLMNPSNWPSDFTSGLTPSEMAEVINWDHVIPTVTTTAVTSITSTTASSGGNVTDAGGSSVYARGVCWNTTAYPTIANSHTSDGSGTGSFTSSITGLSPETTYYVRAYATNEDGTGYGSQVSFTTLGPEMDLLQGATPIADGGTYGFGSRAAGSNTDVVFTIHNSGGANLTLSGSPIITITGADAGYFSVQSQPIATISPSGSTSFTIRFSPTTAGARTAYIAIGNNDNNENPYNLTLTGTGTASALNNVKIVNAAGGAGSEVTTQSLTADETLTVYAAGYDQYGNYVSDQSVSWSGTGVVSGNLSPATGTSTTFTAVSTGTGTITADHATATDDSTGTITVTPGTAASFDVTTEHSGTETAGTPFSVTLTARDADNNIATGYTGAHSLAWTWTATNSPTGVSPTKPADGSQTFASGTVTVSGFTLTDAGETPTITATAEVSGTSGAITVNDGALSYVKIEDTAGGAGSEVTTRGMDSGDTYTVYAAGYDASGNYIADQSVTWSGTGVISGNLSPATGTSTVFTADNAGTGTIAADHSTATDDTTGTITVSAILPVVTTATVSSITTTTAQSGGEVTSDGGGTVTARGVCWSTSANPTTAGSHTTDGTGDGTFTSNLTSLTEDTLYYYRAYATSEAGTSYGAELTFTTEDPPTVSTTAASSVTWNSAVLNGNLTYVGSAASVDVSFEWGTTSGGPYPNTTTAETVSSTGTFDASITSLSANTTYYFRAVADAGDSGTSYGSEQSLTTDDPPTVSTTAASSITWNSAVLNANLSDLGSAASVDVSFEWGTTSGGPYPNTTTAETVSSTGIFDASITSLSANADYYYRAVADGGDSGTSYGDEQSFTTDPTFADVVTSSVISGVTSGSATVSGEVISDGGLTVTRRGFCWSTSSNPTVEPSAPAEGGVPSALSDESTNEGSGVGPFSSELKPLSAGTTYYVRAYAENSLGITYGNEQMFSTEQDGREAASAFINEPGSQLIYLLDTGINAEELYGTDANYTSNSVLQYGNSAPVHQNFISITNTSPEQAVTVHFRYFNSDCVDFFDFLVVLTCNDTMMIDPFDFTVPGTNDVNVKDRFFGYPNKANGSGQSFDAIPASTFADGRFLLFVTASADVKTGYLPEWSEDQLNPDYDNLDLIPYEFINYREEELSLHCAAWSEGGGGDAGEELYGNYPVYGDTNGFSDDNLHILNASAVSFNYLTGFQTVAKVTELGAQAAYMTEAYARPAVFADGPEGAAAMPAPLHVLLTGGERIWTEAAAGGELITAAAGEQFILRHEAHAGDQWDRGEDSFGSNWVISEGGALAWEIFPSAAMPAAKQVVNFFSFMDNYNGESNLAQGAAASVWDDVSYNIQPVVTIYTIQPFNNSEDAWIPSDPANQPIVSPVTPESPLVTAIGVKCINTYEMDPESSLNDAVLGYKFGEFSLQDLFDMNAVLGTDSLTLEGFLNVLAGSEAELANEVGPGWMRLSRWFTTRKWTTTELTPEYVYSYWQGWDDSGEAPYELTGPVIFTQGQANYLFENFGAGKWLSTVNSADEGQ